MAGSVLARTPRRVRALPRPNARGKRGSPLLEVATWVMPRDRQICSDLFEHRVLLTHQIEELYFDSGPVTRRRMVRLYRLGLVDRFRPPAIGSSPWHYVLDVLGAKIVAAERGVDFRELKWRKEDIEAWPYRRDLYHLVDTNSFFTRLLWACRTDGKHRLTDWWSEHQTTLRWGSLVQPDGYGRLEGPVGARSFFFELDRDTEGSARLRAKLPGFASVATLDKCPDLVLFCFPDSDREVFARKVLHSPGLTLATSTWDRVHAEPLGGVWLPLGTERRVPLLELPVEAT